MVYHNKRYKDAIDFINEHKISPNVCDSFGNTVLHLTSTMQYSYFAALAKHVLELPDCNINAQNEEGNTALHMACATGNKSMIEMLLESDKCSNSLINQENRDGHTPLYYTSDRGLINCLILNGADPLDVADSARIYDILETFKKLKTEHPLNPTVTTLVLGNSLAGKTTLIRSLRKTYNWEQCTKAEPSIGQVKLESEHTAGVDMLEYKVFTEEIPRILFHDFAGHPEFHSTHSVLLQNLSSNVVWMYLLHCS